MLLRTAALPLAALHAGIRSALGDSQVDSALALDNECHGDGNTFSAMQRSATLQLSNTSEGSNSSGSYDASCYGNVGSGSCGAAHGGRCSCASGCMGADGNCYSESNKILARGFRLHNVKWTDYVMYMPQFTLFGLLSSTSWSSFWNQGKDKFVLYELPGKLDGQKEFFVASEKWSDYVVAIAATGLLAKVKGLALYGAFAVGLKTSHEPWTLRDIMVKVCSLRSQGHPDAVMLGSSVTTGGSTIWAYLKDKHHAVYGYWLPEEMAKAKMLKQPMPSITSDKPGEGGYWKPEPPFPAGLLPDC